MARPALQRSLGLRRFAAPLAVETTWLRLPNRRGDDCPWNQTGRRKVLSHDPENFRTFRPGRSCVQGSAPASAWSFPCLARISCGAKGGDGKDPQASTAKTGTRRDCTIWSQRFASVKNTEGFPSIDYRTSDQRTRDRRRTNRANVLFVSTVAAAGLLFAAMWWA